MSEALLSDADVGLERPPQAPALLSDVDVGIAPTTQSANGYSTAAAPAIGFNRGLADFVGAPVDFTNWLMGKAGVPVSSTPFGGSESIKKGLGLIGADPSSEKNQPHSTLERVLQSSGEGAAQMIAPEAAIGAMGAAGVKIAPRVAEAADAMFGSAASPAAVAKNAAIGAAAAGTGEAAAQQFDPEAHPYWATGARLAGNLVGGATAIGTTELPQLWNAGKSFVAPMTESGRQGLAGQTLSKAVTNRAATMDALDNAPRELVPGSKPTTFQLTGDMGLGQLERKAATENPALFNTLRAGQNEARLGALQDVQATGSPEDVAAHLRSRLNDLDAQAGTIEAAATQKAQAAVSGLGGSQSPGYYGEAIRGDVLPQVQAATQDAASQVQALGGTQPVESAGAAMRDPLAAAKNAARVRRNGLYDAIDPDNSLNVVSVPLRDASEGLYAKQSPLAAPPGGEEAAIRATIAKLPDVVPFNDLRALDSRVTAAMSQERRTAGESPTWGRLTQLKNAVQGAIDNGVANQIAYERGAVARGAIPEEDAIEARINEWERDLEHEAERAASGAGQNPFEASGPTTPASGLFRAAGEGGGRPANSPGYQAIPKGIGEQVAGRNFGASLPAPGARPVGVMEFIARNGGLKPNNELQSIFGGNNPFVPGVGRIIRNSGMSLDAAHEAAVEAGYIHDPGVAGRGPLETSYNDLLDKIAADHSGASQYPIGTDPAAYHDPLQLRQTESYVRRELSGAGIDVGKLDRRLLDATIDRVASGETPTPLDAFERATIEYHNKLEGEAYARGQEGASYHEPTGEPGVHPNFSPEAADRLAAAKQAHANYAQTFKSGPVGQVLKSSGFDYKAPNAAVPDAIFPKGPKGYETAMAYRKAVNNDPGAISAVENYAASTLRKVAERPDGTLDPGKFSSWKSAYSDALRAYPHLAKRFASVANASEALQRFAPFRADMAPSQLPEVFFHSGPSGGEGVANLRRLIGNDRAESILSDYAAAKLKASAGNPDGTLDPSRVAAFQRTHAEALKALPGLADKFSTAAKAQETVNAVARARKMGIDLYQQGAIGKIMHAAPEDVANHVGSVLASKDATAQMDRLAKEAASDRTGAATAGLRKAVADYMTRKFVSNTEAGTSGSDLMKSDAFQTFLRQSGPALSKVFKREEIASLEAIAADLKRSNRSVVAVKLPGQSNTAQDLSAVAKAAHGKQEPLLRQIVEAGVAGHVAAGAPGAIAGAVGAIGKHLAYAMRAAGYSKVDDLVRDALLNPDLAKALMMKAPLKADTGSHVSLAHQLRRLSVFSQANQTSLDEMRRGPAITGLDLRSIAADRSYSMPARIAAAVPVAIGDKIGALMHSAISAATLPGDVVTGKTDPLSPDAIGRSAQMAGFLGTPGLRGSAAAEKTMASRASLLYNPPVKPPRPFGADYPVGAAANATGKIIRDIEGRPLAGGNIAGRRTVGGADVALTPEEVDASGTQTTGARPQAVASGQIGRNAGLLRRSVNQETGSPQYRIFVDKALPADRKDMVVAHEFGHAIDELSGTIRTDGLNTELRTVYNDMNNPQSHGPRIGPEHNGYKGQDIDRELMAEALRAYMAAPNYLKTVAPKTAAAIRAAVNNNPRLNGIIQFNVGSPGPIAPGDNSSGPAPISRASGGRVVVDRAPSEMQKAVGNYKKHHMRVHGLDVTIENPKGSFREGKGADGKPWRVRIPNHYGYIRGTTGADGDHVDCYVGPDESSPKVWIIDQKDLSTGRFDEHKCMIGFKNRDAAIGGYRKGFSDGKASQRIGSITEMSIGEFKDWLNSGKTSEPFKKAA